ncbi:MAG TPA: hypothetical protein PLR71_02490 [Deltaproteobacteria bacterium]|nr:hypothetical protein [Deltaproteobacteria bacterium]HQI80404.1 hypothetical protein [Deltaproteobacteria bacterium]
MTNRYRFPVTLLLFMIVALAAFSWFPTTASAHPPAEVRLSYDAASQTLTVTITHSTIIPSWHYVKQVEIVKNGAPVSSNKYESQPGKTSFTYTFAVPAAPGDVLEVTCTCNILGSRTAKLQIGKPDLGQSE